MPSLPKKKKVTVKLDSWYLSRNVVQQVGHQESPLFGTEATKFYWRAEMGGTGYSLHLYLATCPEAKVNVKAKCCYGSLFPPQFNCTFTGEISLDKTKKMGAENWGSVSYFTSTELTFKEVDISPAKTTQQKLYESLTNQLLKLRLNTNSADITLLTTVDGREFPAHKWILALRSTVFSAMFEHDEFNENQANRVEIEDVTGEVMDALLNYIYSADVKGVAKIADELLQAADKYDIPLLVEVCVQSLVDSLTSDTAAKCFYIVDLYRLEDAKKKVVKFIGANLRAVRNSDGWEQFIGHDKLQQLFDLLLLA